MLYFRIDCKYVKADTDTLSINNDSNTSKQEAMEFANRISGLSEAACAPYEGQVVFCVSRMRKDSLQIIAVAHMDFITTHSITDICQKFLDFIEINGTVESVTEIVEHNCIVMLRNAERFGYIEDAGEIQDSYVYDKGKKYHNYDESIAEKAYSLKEALLASDINACGQQFNLEIERIFAGKKIEKFVGHPVHYFIFCKDRTIVKNMIEILLGSLVKANRLISRRYAVITANVDVASNSNRLESLYRSLAGGTVVIHCDLDESDSEFANASEEQLDLVCKMMRKYQKTVLTIFCTKAGSESLKSRIMDRLANKTFVELTEEMIFTYKAKIYLRKLAKDNGVTACKGLLKMLPENDKGYYISDLNAIFEKWFEDYLRLNLFSQYASISPNVNSIVVPKGDAFKELADMIGLDEAKSMIKQAIDFYKAQFIFKEKGILVQRPAMHMVFTGNPGTAKTTVARLFAQIMKDNRLLSVGGLFEVGRADLVGKYVGWTANLVKSHFKKARGSVLFIDEAYSLLDDKAGHFGDEAINTIVQEMENLRWDMVVIFAGYPEKMEEFLARNNGLRSRVAFHIHFPDYSVDELIKITQLMVTGRKMLLGSGVEEKLRWIYADAVKTSDFGNGRFVRNILEKALMKQASRLVSMDYSDITDEIAATLLAEDFEIPKPACKPMKSFGFHLQGA
jgi:SpoVK/Ycf46/Vps4 family AAA+-type ATPase